MNPEISYSNNSLENISPKANAGEQSAGINRVERESNAPENVEASRAENSSRVSEIDLTAIFPAPSIQVATQSIAPVISNNNPTVASDLDIIEKEWVDKAKKIVRETQDDPYQQGKKISELQSDYIDKRYGRELGASI